MDGVLESATALCVCKLACSLLLLPPLAPCFSPVSFCSCCLLVFTDFLVTASLSFLCVLESWLPTGHADQVALRFLLFLSHTYGAALLLTTPLIVVETLVRLLWPRGATARRTHGQPLDCHVVEVKVEEEEEDSQLFHVGGFFCCLSLWVIVAFKLRWKWRLEEAWAAACWRATGSLVRCLPRMHSPTATLRPPCWTLVFFILLLALILILLVTSGVDRRLHAESSGAGVEPGQVSPPPCRSAPVGRVDPEIRESSCSAPGLQMSARLHGDQALASPACLSGESGRREHERTMRGVSLTFITEERADSLRGSWCTWRLGAFPCPGVDVMMGSVGLISMFVLPLYLSVNVLVLRAVEALLEDCVITLVSPPLHKADAPPPPPHRTQTHTGVKLDCDTMAWRPQTGPVTAVWMEREHPVSEQHARN